MYMYIPHFQSPPYQNNSGKGHETLIYMYISPLKTCIYMLGTNVKPQARFKAVRTVIKLSGRL